MNIGKMLRNGVAGVMIAAVPVSTSFAATRPNAAVPVAGSTAVTAAQGESGKYFGAWPAYAVILLTILLAIWIATKGDDDGGHFSRG